MGLRANFKNVVEAKRLSKNIFIGNQFAFVRGVGLDKETLASLSLGDPTEVHTIPLCPDTPKKIGSLIARAQAIEAVALNSISTDKKLYRPSEDVHLLIARSGKPNLETQIVFFESGQESFRRTVLLNSAGVGELMLSQLPVGNYKAEFADLADESDPPRFVVAEYRLAPLVAEVQNFRIEPSSNKKKSSSQPTTIVAIKLTTFGNQAEGIANFDLLDDGEVIANVRVEVSDGVAVVKFPCSGNNTLTVNVQMELDPSHTATVELKGTSKSERLVTLFSRIGPNTEGSLAPTSKSRNVRGLQLEENGISRCPIHLQTLHDGTFRLEVKQDVVDLQVRLINLCEPTSAPIHDDVLGNSNAGQTFVLNGLGPMTLVCLGGFVDGNPWEVFGTVISPTRIDAEINVPEVVEPGQDIDVKIHSANQCLAYVLVRDSRLIDGGSIEKNFASALKNGAENLAHLINSTKKPVSCLTLYRPEHLLVDKGVISIEQLKDAYAANKQAKSESIWDSLVRLGYSTERETRQALSEFFDFEFVELDNLEMGQSVHELIPESVARECQVFPVAEIDGVLFLASANPEDLDVQEKLRFILNRDLKLLVTTPKTIAKLINQHYGQIQAESADSMLREFTDTAVDFTESMQVMLSSPASISAPKAAQSSRVNEQVEEGQTLFASLQTVSPGESTIQIGTPIGNREYCVEVTFISNHDGFDWTHRTFKVRAEKIPFIQFDLPKFLHEKDGATGNVFFQTRSGRANVEIKTPTHKAIYEDVDVAELGGKLSFLSNVGEYQATIHDPLSDETNTTLAKVSQPGQIETISRPLILLQPGETVSRKLSPELKALNIVSNLGTPIKNIIKSTCNYQHCCCEQTAAKIRSAVFSFFINDGEGEPNDLIPSRNSILVGIDRMRKMYQPGKGFFIYPEVKRIHSTWSQLAAKHLQYLKLLQEGDQSDSEFSKAIDAGLEMAQDVFRSRQEQTKSAPVDEMSAYWSVRFEKDPNAKIAAEDWIQKRAFDFERSCQLLNSPSNAATRTRDAYLAASLFYLRKPSNLKLGLMIAKQILMQLDEKGALYSTLDSVAALSMLVELKLANVFEHGTFKVNGDVFTDATSCPNEIIEVESLDKLLLVQTMKLTRQSWNELEGNVRTTAKFRGSSKLRIGQRVDFQVQLVDGYQFGDYLTVCLPHSLSRLYGGGQVKQFAVDFEGADRISIPLVTTGSTMDRNGNPSHHRFAVCVRNMYEEERIGSVGWQKVRVV